MFVLFSFLHISIPILLQDVIVEKSGQPDQNWIYESGSFHDPFYPFFIGDALNEQSWMESLVFSLDSLSGLNSLSNPSNIESPFNLKSHL